MKTKLVIFGITGHLAQHKLLPALSRVIDSDKCEDLSIIGVSRRPVQQFEVLGEHHTSLQGTTSMFHMDPTNDDDYLHLKDYIDQQSDEQVLFYLSVPPLSVGGIIEKLGAASLNSHQNKLLLEKPFGTDYSSALSMIHHTSKHFNESQIYRIDHYLAKEMAQNIVTFRAQNAIFSYLWSNKYIEKIEISALERVDIEGRSDFYEQTGALRDIVQGHLLQLLALILLDLPDNEELKWSSLPERRYQALSSLELAQPSHAIRGQYDGYRAEVGNTDSNVETFVHLELASADSRWKGVPILLTTGKALDKKETKVKISFRNIGKRQRNDLTFSIQPDEGIEVDLVTKKPGYEQESELQKLGYNYPKNTYLPDAYEQVLVDAVESRKSLFASSAEVLRAWEILSPLQQSWQHSNDIRIYPKGFDTNSVINHSPQQTTNDYR